VGQFLTWIPQITEDLVKVQCDAIEFISMFRVPIRTNAPHIYLSGLTFAPTSSLLYQWWKGQFPGVAKLVYGHLQHWPHIRLILEGHRWGVTCVAFSPDGRQIVSGSEDMTV
jgi:WD40 repeat protein